MAEAPSTRELQELVNDPRWPSFRGYIQSLREEANRVLTRRRGLEHHEMTRLAGEIYAYDTLLDPAVSEENNPSPRSDR